jgi:hypothetical protein
MPLVSVTRLHVRSRWYMPQFLVHSLRSIGQARRAPGYLGGWTANDGEGGFWTATVWQSADTMRSFRNSGAHLRAMPKLLHMSDQASFTHFDQEGTETPTPESAYESLKRQGRLSKVNAPSPQHVAGEKVGRNTPRRPQQWTPKPRA